MVAYKGILTLILVLKPFTRIGPVSSDIFLGLPALWPPFIDIERIQDLLIMLASSKGISNKAQRAKLVRNWVLFFFFFCEIIFNTTMPKEKF